MNKFEKTITDQYNPEEDILISGGSDGINYAEEIYHHKELEKIAEIAFRNFPPEGPGETVGDKELIRRLSEIKKTGYKFRPYSSLNKAGKWKLLKEIRTDLRNKLENYPDLKEKYIPKEKTCEFSF